MGRQRTPPQKGEEDPQERAKWNWGRQFINIEFKVMVIRILKELSVSYINMIKDMETTNKNNLEMKNTLEGIQSRPDEREDQLSDLKDKVE